MPQRTLSQSEFESIKRDLLMQAPDGLSEADFGRWIGPRFESAIAIAEQSPRPIDGSALGRFVAGAWEMLNPVEMVKGTASAIAHPVETVKGIGQAHLEQAKTARELAGQGRYVEAAGHGAAAALPVLGPIAASAGEQMASGDVAGGLGKAVGAIAPVLVPSAARAIPKTRAAVKDWATARRTAQVGKQTARATSDILAAMPPSKAASYDPGDLSRARPYLEAEHQTSRIVSVQTLRDAADSAITGIEGQIKDVIKQHAAESIQGNVLDVVQSRLGQSVRGDFAKQGVNELSDLGLDRPLTLERADAIRLQLNAENRAVLTRNQYDQSTARHVDPGFAAREVASKFLRDAIYDRLETLGLQGARQLRRDEGSLIALRNAAERQIYAGARTVQQGRASLPRRIAQRAATGVGAASGAAIAGPAGAVVGSEIGAQLRFIKPNMTRDALIARAFGE